MNRNVAVPNPSQRKGRFTRLSLKEGRFPLTEGIIEFNGRTFLVRRYFEEVPMQVQAVVTQAVHALIACEGLSDVLIAVRLFESSRAATKNLYLNELGAPDTELNFGYLTFRVRPEDLHIRDYDPLAAHTGPRAGSELRAYGRDLDLTRLVLDVFADIAREVYGKTRLVNTYPYPNEADRFLTSGFEEIRGPDQILRWIREL